MVFEPLIKEGREFYQAHNSMDFYTWGGQECCLLTGATAATLKDAWIEVAKTEPVPPQEPQVVQYKRPTPPAPSKKQRALHLAAGDVLIFEEVLGPKTGNPADADPNHRYAVRLTKVTPDVDDLTISQL